MLIRFLLCIHIWFLQGCGCDTVGAGTCRCLLRAPLYYFCFSIFGGMGWDMNIFMLH